MTWYSNEMQILIVIIWLVSLIVIAPYFLIEVDDIFKGFMILIFIIATTFGTYEYLIKADEKQHEEIASKYKYEIEVIKGKDCETYYTNEYKIENGIVYFDGKCANNFSIETLE